MKATNHLLRAQAVPSTVIAILLFLSFAPVSVHAANKTWDGGGEDDFWLTGANWNGNSAPGATDPLFFTGTVRLANTNNFADATVFSGITFNTPAGAFILSGNQMTLGGGITNNQVVVTETIGLPLLLNATRDVSVANSASLTISGVISGAGFGLTKSGGGLLTLSGANTFSGPLTINAGTVSAASDGNLGAVPGAVTPGNVVINNSLLRTPASFAINANRGIALGPTTGSGFGTINVPAGSTLTYGGIMADNGGTAGLTKTSFGGLTLSGANTYSGQTIIANGTVTLDFTPATAPVNNIVSTVSPLTLGGANAGFGATNFAALTMNGKGATVNSQAFNGTSLTFGGSVIRVNSGAGGTANLALGLLGHDPGGVLVMVPPTLAGGTGNITTTATNINGILGGFATVGDGSSQQGIVLGTNFASVDASGNVINFTGYRVLANGEKLHNISTAGTNISIPASVTGDMLVNDDNAGTLTDVNAINWNRTDNNVTLKIGAGNTLRLGRYGSIFKPNTTAGLTWLIGQTAAAGNSADQDIGTLTAGGADNTPGEIIVNVNNTSSSSGTLIIDAKVTDNGTGPVTFVKTGVGSMKLRGHNTYSGGTFLLQGRVQFVGGEGGVGTGNADGGGTGPIYILPGCYLFPSGTGPMTLNPPQPVTNAVFIAGNGTAGEPLGAIRTSGNWLFNGPWTLIGDTTLGGNGGASGAIGAKLSGPFNLALCSPITVNGTVCLTNSANDWDGTTTLNARNNAGANTFLSGNSEIIPNGFGKGNVVMNGFSVGTIIWNLNGFSETINGLSTTGTGSSCSIVNNGGTSSTLTIGDNDQSGTFAGTILDGAGQVALTKIGGGALTLTAANTYGGNTTVSGGVLALSDAGSIANSADILVNNGGALHVAGLSDFSAPLVRMSSGTLVGNSANMSIASLTMTNSQLTVVPDTGDINITITSLTTGGATNRINITTVAGISGYPAEFTIIDYTGSIGGAGNNFGIGEVPSTNTVGYVSNDVVNARIVLVLLDGPKPLTWTGSLGRNWDEGATTNWLAFKGGINETPAPFNRADSTFFNDTGLTNDVNLISVLVPGGVTVTNEALNYTFAGSGFISGLGGLLKQGAATLTLANTIPSDFRGGVAVNGGTVIFATDNAIAGGVNIASGTTAQVGTNGPSGTLPGGNVAVEGSLLFNRTNNFTVANNISGNGTLTKNNAGVVTLSGANNSFTGAVTVVQGTLRAGSGSALGTADGSTTVNIGATLDVGGQALTTEPVIVSGAGVTNGGAIINSGAEQVNALGSVTLANHTTFGGSGRWDIRGGAATLSTGGGAYNITKVGANQVSLVGLTTIDAGLGDIDIQQGIFAVQTTTVQVGDSTKTITVRTNAALSLFGLNANPLNKVISVQSGGAITNESGASIISGPVTLNGNSVIGVAGTSLTFDGAIGGSGNLRKLGGGTLILNGANAYSGSITNLGGTLVVNGVNSGGGALTNVPGTTLAGRGTHTGPVSLGTNTTFLPGGAGVAGTFSSGSLTLNSARIIFDLGTNDFTGGGFPANDLIEVNGNLTLSGVTTNTINPGPLGVITNGQIITLIHYTGARTGSTNNLRLVSPPGYGFSFIDPATTTNFIRVMVNKAPLNIVWRGGVAANPTAWDIEMTTNWVSAVDNSTLVDYSDFDGVSFGDTANTNLVTLATNLQPASIAMNNNALTYTFAGSGRLRGASGLTLQGSGALIIANSGSNDFTGPININAGLLQVGDGSTNGNLGSGNLTNQSALVFNRSGNLTVNNNIAGAGSLTNNGRGVVALGGANTYDGTVMINQGTLRAGSGTALGSVLAGTIITNGATLDTGGQTLNNEQVTVTGPGVGGLGAIVNNVTDAANGLGNVTMEGHTTFGGTRRWDIRGGAATLSTSGNPYNLTKVGSNQVSLVGVAVDGALADIIVREGTFSVETATSTLGNPANTLTVSNGATLQFWSTTVPWTKVFVLNGNGVATTVNVGNGVDNNISSALALSGGCIFNVVGGAALTLNGGLNGSASLTKTGGGLLTLTTVNAYTGDTTVNGGTLTLTGPASLPATATIITIGAGATLDVTALTAGPTLTLASGQKLQGSGSVNGSVQSPAGSTVAPGLSVGLLTVTNDVTLQGTTIMELRPTLSINDRLRTVTGSITYGGLLIVTNLDGVFAGTESFKLFDSGTGSYLNSFSSIQLPPLPAGYTWNTSQLTVDGTLRLKGPPEFTAISLAGGNVIIRGFSGTTNGEYYVLTSTNVTQPSTNWTRLATNVFDANGNFSFTNAVDLNTPQRFYQLLLP